MRARDQDQRDRKRAEEFAAVWRRLGSPALVAKELGVTVTSCHARRGKTESILGIKLEAHNDQSSRAHARQLRLTIKNHEGRIDLEIENGCVIVFSDAHYYPGAITTAHRGLITLIKQLKPKAVICNGDAFDGATISRHPRIGWDKKPTVLEELRVVDERLSEVERAAKGAELIWSLGNHDSRMECFLAANAPQFEGVHGFRLKDHFPRWRPCWSTWINDSVVVKHRMRSGVHATHNNTVNAGTSIVTGHLHQLKVTPFSDYRGRRYGVDSGTLADLYSAPFIDYTEAGPVNWHSGFVVLSFKNGALLAPELVSKFDEGIIEFRGHLINVDTGAIL
jgi:Calcineurin-like phosphoesterase